MLTFETRENERALCGLARRCVSQYLSFSLIASAKRFQYWIKNVKLPVHVGFKNYLYFSSTIFGHSSIQFGR